MTTSADKAIYEGTDWASTSGPSLYRAAKKVIPGGTQLLSKRPEQFLPEQWPAYYSKSKGCALWDLDGRKFIDMTFTGIGACLLGFADEDVNAATKQAVDNGTMTTLNPPDEVELARLLCDLHPWASMARFARCGGEIAAIAVRIARAYTGRDKILVCGYHGWQDWYLAANLGADKALDGHLLPGLEPNGVPRGLSGTTHTFRYNEIDDLKGVIAKHGKEIAAIVMEPCRYDLPKDGFLEKVRKLADEAGIVLIFDEITSGWRHCTGGQHLSLGVNPDMAVFAKAISNGVPMAAVIGKTEVMQAAQGSFISSTYWTDAMGPAAALATIKKMRRIDLPQHVARIGNRTKEGWTRLSEKHGIGMKLRGLPALTGFSFEPADKHLALRTLLTQSMLDRGFLAGEGFYPTYAHTDDIIDQYLDALDETFEILKKALADGDVAKYLRGPVAFSGFKRLN